MAYSPTDSCAISPSASLLFNRVDYVTHRIFRTLKKRDQITEKVSEIIQKDCLQKKKLGKNLLECNHCILTDVLD